MFFFATNRDESAKHPSFPILCIEMHRSNILFSPRLYSLSLFLSFHPFGQKGREVGKIRKQER